MFIVAAALIVAGVALFVAAPLGIGLLGARAKSPGELQIERYEHERGLAVQGLRELEFDREMGKLSDADYESMHKALEERALTAMAAVESSLLQTRKDANSSKPAFTPVVQAPRRPESPPRRADAMPAPVAHAEPPGPPQSSPAASGRVRFCSQCGTRAPADSKFCAQCGVAIRPIGGGTAWAD